MVGRQLLSLLLPHSVFYSRLSRWHCTCNLSSRGGTQVAKSPAAPSAAVAFRVTARGLEADAAAPQLQQAAGSVVGQAIAHGMDYEPGGS